MVTMKDGHPGAGMSPPRTGLRARLLPWLALALLTVVAAPASAAVEASVDRTVVAEGESLRLRIEATGDTGDAAPDLAPLERDFEVAGTRQSNRVSIVNGRVTSSRTWEVNLVPRRRGKLAIPALEVGGDRTRPITVTVREAPAAEGGARDVFLEVEARPRAPYVQAQVSYTVRILYRELAEGDLADPEIENAVVRRHGEDIAYDVHRDGRRYRVLERRYVIFPQRSGTLEVPPPVFVGRVPDGGGGAGSPFGRFGAFDQLFQDTRVVRRRGEALTLDVRARPEGFDGDHWLPAADLTLEEEWAGGEGGLRVGEPLTRTLVLRARGLEAAQLPEMAPPAGPGYRAYADQPELETAVAGADVVGRRVESHTFIPTRPGRLRLPPVVVRWWSTEDEVPRRAELPAREVMVAPAAGGAPSPPAAREPAAEPTGAPAPADAAAVSAPANTRSSTLWPLATALAVAAWLVTLALLLGQRRGRTRDIGDAAASPPRSPGPAIKALEDACTARDPAAARDALLAWGQARWPRRPPLSLPALGRRSGDELAAAVAEIDRALYAGGAGTGPGAETWRRLPALVKAVRPPPAAGGGREPLPELYPQGGKSSL